MSCTATNSSTLNVRSSHSYTWTATQLGSELFVGLESHFCIGEL